MTLVRTLLTRRWLAVAIILAALAVRMVIPAGMMPAFGHGATFTICTGHGAVVTHDGSDPAKSAASCAFTGLTAAAIDAPVVAALAALPLWLRAVAIMAVVVASVRSVWRRPPSQGPPGLRAA